MIIATQSWKPFAPGSLAWLPAILLLLWMWPLRVGTPYWDSWAFVQQYQQ